MKNIWLAQVPSFLMDVKQTFRTGCCSHRTELNLCSHEHVIIKGKAERMGLFLCQVNTLAGI